MKRLRLKKVSKKSPPYEEETSKTKKVEKDKGHEKEQEQKRVEGPKTGDA